jgi:uncharacterized membrane protein YfcA
MRALNFKKTKPVLGGFTAGFINGLLGAGGGMVAVPIIKGMGVEQKRAHSSSVAVIMPLSLFSAAIYLFTKSVKFSDVLPFLPAGLLGAAVGTLIVSKIPQKWLKILFSAFMIWAGVRLILR